MRGRSLTRRAPLARRLILILLIMIVMIIVIIIKK